HTSFSRDWSSDVCSSDLDEPGSGDVPDGERVDGEVDADAAGFAGVEGDAGESLEFAEWLFDAGDPLVGVALDDFFTEAVAGVGEVGRASCRDRAGNAAGA